MSTNYKVSADIDELLRKSTRADVRSFLGVTTNANNIATNENAIALNTAKVGITPEQASEISANTLKAGITPEQALAISTVLEDIVNIEANINSLYDEQQSNGNAIQTNIADIATNTASIATKAPISGPAFTGSASFAGDLTLNGNTTFQENVTFNEDIEITALASADVLEILGKLTVDSTAGLTEIKSDLKITGDTEFGEQIKVTNGNLSLEDGGIEITTNAEIELQGNGGLVLQGAGDVQLQGGGNVTVTGDGKIKLNSGVAGSIVEINKSSIDFNSVETLNIEERRLVDENGTTSLNWNDRTKIVIGTGDSDTTTRVGIGKSNPSQALDVAGTTKTEYLIATLGAELQGDSLIGGELIVEGELKADQIIEADRGIILQNTNKAITKQRCYNKTGAVRLQRDQSEDDEILMRYNGSASNDFLIQQFSGGVEKGQIRFLGQASVGSRLRLEADVVDVGSTRTGYETSSVKINSDAEILSDKKLVFKDSRDETDGLHFEHTGPNAPDIQMGMYGNSGASDFGQFKITQRSDAGVSSDVLILAKDNSYIQLDSLETKVKRLRSLWRCRNRWRTKIEWA